MKQGAGTLSVEEARGDLEVPAGGGVQHQAVRLGVVGNPVEMLQIGTLGLLEIVDGAAGRRDRQGMVLDSEPREGAGPRESHQGLLGRVMGEGPPGHRIHQNPGAEVRRDPLRHG